MFTLYVQSIFKLGSSLCFTVFINVIYKTLFIYMQTIIVLFCNLAETLSQGLIFILEQVKARASQALQFRLGTLGIEPSTFQTRGTMLVFRPPLGIQRYLGIINISQFNQ